MKRLLTIFLLSTTLGCQDPDEIPFQNAAPIVVVEGWLTDSLSTQYVKISTTVEFASVERSAKVTDALVTLYSDSEPVAQYIHQGNGIYGSEDSIRGVGGEKYFLEIELSSHEIIRSHPEIMQDVSPIDSIGFDSFLRENEDDPQEEVVVYFPVAFSGDPEGEENFYRWKLFRNDTLFSAPEELFLFSDRFVDGNSNVLQEFTGYEFKINDTARLEIIEISQSAFKFLNELKSQKTTIGTNSAVSPAPIRGNLYYPNHNRQVLGFFGTASIKSKEKIVQ